MIVHRISDNESEQRAYYRLLNNKRLSIEALIESIIQDCERQVEPGEHYLVFQDTTQPSLERNRKNIQPASGLGVLSDNRTLGFFLHPGLVLHASSGRCLGYSSIEVWSRNGGKEKCRERDYKSEPIEAKESYRWLKCVQRSRQVLHAAGRVTVVSDREGDVYEVFERLPDPQTHLLVRSKADRIILNENAKREKLLSYIQRQRSCGRHALKVDQDQRKNRQARTASLEIRIGQVGLLQPTRLGKNNQPVATLFVVEAKESATTCPAGEEPIHWVLLTTHEVKSLEEALQVIGWYKWRWNAEQVFRLSKRKGLDIEQSDLENGRAIIKTALIAIFAASKIILLHQASKQEEPVPMEKTFTPQQKQCLNEVGRKMEGNTPKQKNPYPTENLQWAYWIIARLGGWKPHEKQAGVIALFRGWQRFNQIFEGWQLAQDVS